MKYAHGIYEGYWKNGFKDGFGREIFPSGSCYEGQFKAGLREGQGVYTWANGDQHKGAWLQNKRYGKGKFTKPNQSWYEGDWQNEVLIHGFGVLNYALGDPCRQYTGRITNGKPHGTGVMKYTDYSIFNG